MKELAFDWLVKIKSTNDTIPDAVYIYTYIYNMVSCENMLTIHTLHFYQNCSQTTTFNFMSVVVIIFAGVFPMIALIK